LNTVGLTAATELAPFVFRTEALHTAPKHETVGVLGIDYTQIANWRLGAQFSDTYLFDHHFLVTVLAAGPVFGQTNLDLMLSYVPTDGSSLAQIKYLVPLASRIELVIGADILLGGGNTQFGRFRDASRGYVLLKGYLMGT
jgi:hypothetical protein